MRCEHVHAGKEKTCKNGCYAFEKGGGAEGWFCRREDKKGCEGHIFAGRVKINDKGVACFGKKGKRIVLLERS
jgi:hypothetical protein